MQCKVSIRPTNYGEPGTSAILTDEHSASSYGQPVLVMADGSVCGPAEYPYTLGADEEHELIARWNELVIGLMSSSGRTRRDPAGE